MPESRLQILTRWYIAIVIGFVLGMICPLPGQDTSSTTGTDQLDDFEIDELKGNEPTPLQYLPTYPPPPPDFRFDWDKALLNLPVAECRALPNADADPRCAYMNATHAVHPRDLLNQWLEAHRKRPPQVVIREIK